MRLKATILCAVIITGAFAGCAERQQAGSSASQAAFSVSVPENESAVPVPESDAPEPPEESIPAGPSIDAPPAEMVTPGLITVYRYRDSGIYEPSGYTVPEKAGGATLLTIIRSVESELDIAFPVLSITQQKGMVVIDIDESFTSDYNKAQVNEFLNSLGATLRENHRPFEWVQYQSNGETGIYGEQWEIPPLKLIEGAPEEFAAIRAEIPYEGLLELYTPEPVIETDETGMAIIGYLSRLPAFDTDIASVSGLENAVILQILLDNTKPYYTLPDYDGYRPELKPFVAPASEYLGMQEDMFWLKEHIEATAKLLFGDGYTVSHGDVGRYRYIEQLGVYTPPHMGGGSATVPVLISYGVTPTGYRAEVAYFTDSMGGRIDPDDGEGWEKLIAEADTKDYALAKSRRREIILEKAVDGRLLFVSHRYL